jgi:heme A synthase
MTTAGAALVSATPVAVWWLVGDLDEKGADDRDRMFRPFEVSAVVENGAGVVAMLAVITAVGLLGLAWYRRRLPRGLAGTLTLLCLAGAILGGGWRVLTAASVGANIGGGLVLAFGYPLAGLLVLAAVMDRRRSGGTP